MNKTIKINLFALSALFIGASFFHNDNLAYANDGIVSHAPQESTRSATQSLAEIDLLGQEAPSRLPMVSNPALLPPRAKRLVEAANERKSMAYGSTGMSPFTTKRALTSTKGNTSTRAYHKKDLARGTGKLWMRFDTTWYVCTASLIDKGIVVTAAHCVHNFGEEDAGWADEVLFQPMRDGNRKPYGNWKGEEWLVPEVYWNGTDTCTAEGVVCENDIALVVIKKKSGRYVGKRVFNTKDYAYKYYPYQVDDYSYVSFAALVDSPLATQITQLGYPVALDEGYRMIRTDSLGIQDTPSNVFIASDQSGGSSGGPWFVNYGRDYVSSDTTPTDSAMAIMAVTSWGYTDANMKIQGASRFATNTTFTTTSNIETLHANACELYPKYCYAP